MSSASMNTTPRSSCSKNRARAFSACATRLRVRARVKPAAASEAWTAEPPPERGWARWQPFSSVGGTHGVQHGRHGDLRKGANRRRCCKTGQKAGEPEPTVRGSGEQAGEQWQPGERDSAETAQPRGGAMTIEQQQELVGNFVRGVVERFGFDAETTVRLEDEHLLVDVTGDDLGSAWSASAA